MKRTLESRRYENLRDLRYMNGRLTQEEAAEKIGINTCAYSKIEKGHTYGSVRTWRKIQEVFGLNDAETWQLMARK